ncbi:MAG: hypothetical protein ABIH63_04180 [archaeon]
MSSIKKLVFAISMIGIGLFVYHSQFLADLESYKPANPWWDMGCWYYYAILWGHKYGSIVSMVFGTVMFIVLAVKQCVNFFRDFFKNHLYT